MATHMYKDEVGLGYKKENSRQVDLYCVLDFEHYCSVALIKIQGDFPTRRATPAAK